MSGCALVPLAVLTAHTHGLSRADTGYAADTDMSGPGAGVRISVCHHSCREDAAAAAGRADMHLHLHMPLPVPLTSWWPAAPMCDWEVGMTQAQTSERIGKRSLLIPGTTEGVGGAHNAAYALIRHGEI